MNETLEKFEEGNFVFIYYRFLDKFHVVPESWRDLFEYLHYNEVDSGLNNIVQKSLEEENKK